MTRKTLAQSDPRVTGGRYLSGYWNREYTVTSLETRDGIRWLTVEWHPWTETSHPRVSRQWEGEDSRRTTHCTPWDAKRDVIISQP